MFFVHCIMFMTYVGYIPRVHYRHYIISLNISYHVVRYEADERQDDVAGSLPQRG